MSDGEEKNNPLQRPFENSFEKILKEKYGELKDQGIDPDPDGKLAEALTPLRTLVGKAIGMQMAYEIIGPMKWSFDGEGYGMPGTIIFDINHHPDNRPLWDFINDHINHVHFVNDAKDRFYFDDNEISIMLKLMM